MFLVRVDKRVQLNAHYITQLFGCILWDLVSYEHYFILFPILIIYEEHSLYESLSISTLRCDLAIATHARKMHKKIFVVVHPEVLDND